MPQVAQIRYDQEAVIGTGSTSLVYSGKIQDRKVAVKQVSKQHNLLIKREIDLLLKSDNHPNIIRYFMVAEDETHHYIALELCQLTLAHYVNRKNIQFVLPKKNVIWKIFQGMKRLHEIGIVHRDIKPSNILFLQVGPNQYEVKISDFGYSKDVGERNGSQMSMVPNGSSRFNPPESQFGRFNSKSDVFMVGGLIYFIYKNGNVSNNSQFSWLPDSEQKCDDVLIKHLILIMTKKEHDQRPSMYCLCFHPYFWTCQKILDFLMDVSNRLELRDDCALRAISALQEDSEAVTQGNWVTSLDLVVQMTLPHRNRMSYNENSVPDLIRALRNKKNHYDDMSLAAKQALGSLPGGYTGYWINKFPKLLLHVYLKWYKSGLYAEDNFKQFYPDPKCN